jgi:hypothetical protein
MDETKRPRSEEADVNPDPRTLDWKVLAMQQKGEEIKIC